MALRLARVLLVCEGALTALVGLNLLRDDLGFPTSTLRVATDVGVPLLVGAWAVWAGVRAARRTPGPRRSGLMLGIIGFMIGIGTLRGTFFGDDLSHKVGQFAVFGVIAVVNGAIVYGTAHDRRFVAIYLGVAAAAAALVVSVVAPGVVPI